MSYDNPLAPATRFYREYDVLLAGAGLASPIDWPTNQLAPE